MTRTGLPQFVLKQSTGVVLKYQELPIYLDTESDCLQIARSFDLSIYPRKVAHAKLHVAASVLDYYVARVVSI